MEFPHAPSETCQTGRSLAESSIADDDPTSTGESLGEARERRRPLLRENTWGRCAKAAATAPGGYLEEAREGRRQLLREIVWGSPRRVAATSPGDESGS